MRTTIRALLATIAGAALALAVPTAASAGAPAPDEGRITGVVSNSQDARLLPCGGVGVACFPKKSPRWSVDQVDDCWLRSDVTTGFRMMGTCVLAVDEGHQVRLWAPAGSIEEDFRLIWEG